MADDNDINNPNGFPSGKNAGQGQNPNQQNPNAQPQGQPQQPQAPRPPMPPQQGQMQPPRQSQFSPTPPMQQPQAPRQPMPPQHQPGQQLPGGGLNNVVSPTSQQQHPQQGQPQYQQPTQPQQPQGQPQYQQPMQSQQPQGQPQYQQPMQQQQPQGQPQYQQPMQQQPQGQPQYQQQMQQQYQGQMQQGQYQQPSQPQYAQQNQQVNNSQEKVEPPPLPYEVNQVTGDGALPHGVEASDLAKLPSSLSPAEIAAAQDGGVKRKRIGERFMDMGLITPDQLNVALHEQKKTGKMLGETLVALGFLGADMLTHFLSQVMGYEEFNPKTTVVDPEALKLIDKKDAAKYRVIPVSLSHQRGELTLAMADPDDVMALDNIKQIIPKGYNIIRQICSPALINDAIHRVYGVSTSIEDILRELTGDKNAAKQNMDSLNEDEAYSHPLVRLVNAILFEAAKLGASDLHFEPEESFARVRYRIDGDLVAAHTFHKEYWGGICQRLKIISGMNIADKLTPQDGRFSMNMGGRDADFRVSSLPTVHGENIVLRLLDKNASIVPLDKLDFSEINMRMIKKSLAKPEGIILVTGPTGSGKTTTLYSMINAVNTIDVNIMTLEDPVEYSLPNIRQTNIREATGFTFAEGVKSLLRQDPDIIFVGEVRDEVTAEQALKAAMTGHQVFTTLHANDTFGSIPRLMDLGLKPGMMAGSIISVFAQRLVRRICPHCKTPYQASREECILLGVNPEVPLTLYKGVGCKNCSGTGSKGRIAIHEILYMDEEINSILAANGDKGTLKKKAVELGFKSMRDDGILKLYKGLISLQELRRVANFADLM